MFTTESPWTVRPAEPLVDRITPRARGERKQGIWPSHILVASHAGASADAAIEAARALAATDALPVDLFAVYPRGDTVMALGGHRGTQRCGRGERAAIAGLLRRVRRQLRRLRVSGRRWTVRAEMGEPVAAILAEVGSTAADLVVVGIGQHEPTARRNGDATPLALAQFLEVPLLAAAPGRRLPASRCLVLLDDRVRGYASVRAAGACTAEGGVVWLVQSRRDDGAILRRKSRDKGIAVHDVIVERATAESAMDLAARLDVDLVVVAIHGAPGPVRAFVDNAAVPLLLGSSRSVLVVPDGWTAA